MGVAGEFRVFGMDGGDEYWFWVPFFGDGKQLRIDAQGPSTVGSGPFQEDFSGKVLLLQVPHFGDQVEGMVASQAIGTDADAVGVCC